MNASSNVTFALPVIAAIRDGVANVPCFDAAAPIFKLAVATRGDVSSDRNDRNAYIVANRQPLALRCDRATWRGDKHAMPACGFSESLLAYMPNHRLFASTGDFFASPSSESVITASRYKSVVAMASATWREAVRFDMANNGVIFSPATFYRRVKTSDAFTVDLNKAAENFGGVAARGSEPYYRDSFTHILCDLFVCGAIFVPVDSSPRSLVSGYRVNAAWRASLHAAVTAHDAAIAAAAAADKSSDDNGNSEGEIV
jgi:hypothetical protein